MVEVPKTFTELHICSEYGLWNISKYSVNLSFSASSFVIKDKENLQKSFSTMAYYFWISSLIYVILLDLMSNGHQSCNYREKSSRQYCMFLMFLSSYHTFSLFLFCAFLLINFMPLVSFYIPQKHKQPSDLMMFSKAMEKDQWHEMN